METTRPGARSYLSLDCSQFSEQHSKVSERSDEKTETLRGERERERKREKGAVLALT